MYPHNLEGIEDTRAYIMAWEDSAWKEQDFEEYEFAVTFGMTLGAIQSLEFEVDPKEILCD